MQKLSLIIALALIMADTAIAQITRRYENDSAKVSFATRPKKGDKALMMHVLLRDSAQKINKIQDLINLANNLNFRYYVKDNLVFRAGLKVKRDAKTNRGSSADSSFVNQITTVQKIEKYNATRSNQILVMPGLEKHVNAKNIFDVYYGASIPIGFEQAKIYDEIKLNNGDYVNKRTKYFSPLLGLDAFAGVNIFIGKLPLSLGLEYNWSAMWQFNNSASVSEQQQTTQANVPSTFVAEYKKLSVDALGNADNNLYGKLANRNFVAGANNVIKFTLNVYFR